MIPNNVRILLKYLDYKRKYPDANIELGADVRKDSVLGRNVTIASSCLVMNSLIGDNAIIDKGCYIQNTKLEQNVLLQQESHFKEVEIGKFSYVALNALMLTTKVGRFCSIGPSLICAPGEHPTNFVSTSPAFYLPVKDSKFSFYEQGTYFESYQETTIGHDVWIGSRVFMKSGVKIGNGAVIAAGAVVVKDVPNYAIVGGVPAKIIRFRFPDEVISELLKIQWWNWSEEKLREARDFFIKENIISFIEWVNKEYFCKNNLG